MWESIFTIHHNESSDQSQGAGVDKFNALQMTYPSAVTFFLVIFFPNWKDITGREGEPVWKLSISDDLRSCGATSTSDTWSFQSIQVILMALQAPGLCHPFVRHFYSVSGNGKCFHVF